MSALTVQLSRRITRQLDLGKGMFFDADAMGVLAECGALDLIQKRASDYLKARVAARREACEESEVQRFTTAGHAAPAGTRHTRLRLVNGSSEDAHAKTGTAVEANEALARVRRKLETRGAERDRINGRLRKALQPPKPRQPRG